MQIEDGKPADNIFSEKQMRLLTDPLYTSWNSEKNSNFLATANVGIFTKLLEEPIVPDVLLSLNVKKPISRRKKEDKCYYLDKLGKAPEVVIEIVSNKDGNELGSKLDDYGKIGVKYYAIFDPYLQIQAEELSGYEYNRSIPRKMEETWFKKVGLGLRLWEGEYENEYGLWLRWCDYYGEAIPTGKELNRLEKEQTEIERQRAKKEKQRADMLAKKLRSMGIDPDSL